MDSKYHERMNGTCTVCGVPDNCWHLDSCCFSPKLQAVNDTEVLGKVYLALRGKGWPVGEAATRAAEFAAVRADARLPEPGQENTREAA